MNSPPRDEGIVRELMLGRWPFGSRAKAVRNSPSNGDVIKKRKKKKEEKRKEKKRGKREKILCASSGPRSRTGALRFRAKSVAIRQEETQERQWRVI